MERQSKDNPQMMRRTPRMLHESSFATSAFTSSRGQRRPPGFVASSLDYKSRRGRKMVAHIDVTTKPGSNKKHKYKQEEEYLEREKQYQQRRQYRSGHPTRAQGNFGPPPQVVNSLKDLENMSEEQIYKLFTEDPNFHQAFLEATEKGQQETETVPSSAPVGAKKGRRSTERKPYSKTNRSTFKTKKINSEDVEREVPYLQWIFLFIMIGAAIYKSLKSSGSPISTKAYGGISKNVVIRKQKSKKGRKPVNKASTRKNTEGDDANLARPTTETVIVKKKSSSTRRKKKKKTNVSMIRSTIVSSDFDKGNENDGAQIEEEQPEPNLVAIDGSSMNDKSKTAKMDNIIHIESDSSPISNDNDETWQTVTKSSKGVRKGKIIVDQKPIEEIKVSEQPFVQNMVDDDDSVRLKNNACKISVGETNSIAKTDKTEEKKDVSFADKDEIDNAQTIAATRNDTELAKEGYNKASKEEHSKDEDGKHRMLTRMENDAALALKLHEEEVNLARAANENREDEVWEEVTIRKRKA